MKKYNFKHIIPVALSSLVILYACNKSYLEVPAAGALSQATLANKIGVEALLVGAYSLLDGEGSNAGTGNGPWATSSSNWVYGSVAGGDAHKGSDPGDQNLITPIEQWNATASNGYLDQLWQQRYDGVQRSNEALRILKLAKDVTAADVARISAEARFLRAHYHFELAKNFNNIPYIDETITYAAGNFAVANGPALAKIEADFKFAYDNLPETMNGVGRANKWAAAAYLGKVYMFEKKYAEAAAIFKLVVASGKTSTGVKYALLSKFADVNNAATKNGSEHIFSVQMTVNDGTGAANAATGDALNFPYGGQTGCCGFYQPSFSLANAFKVDANGLPFLDESYNATPLKTDMGLSADQAYTPDSTTPLDPRIDWTVGRRGIPYLDWDIMPGSTWVRNQAAAGPYEPIKHVFYKSQIGVFTDGSSWTNGFTANNFPIIRLADVLLMQAEAAVETGDLATALTNVNLVRARAANPAGFVGAGKNNGGLTSVANYKIGLYTAFSDAAYARKAVRFERKLELAMEGHRFYDLTRWGAGKTELDAYAKSEAKQGYTSMSGVTYTTGKSEYLPIPQAQIDKTQKDGKSVLTQNPGY
jgi:tetratricopeptide (TPR) repeat protein